MKPKSKRIVVVGCSRLGARLASILSMEGNDLTIIDKSEESFRKLSDEFSGYTFLGDAENMQMLEDARVADADIVITVTDNDNVNLMISEVCKKIYNVPNVLCRLQDSSKNIICQIFNIHFIDTSSLALEEFKSFLKGLV